MILKDMLQENAFIFGIKGTSKEEIIKEISEQFNKVYGLDSTLVFDALWSRENKGSTGLGKKLAIPHARMKELSNMKLMVLYSKEGKDFASYDQIPTHLFFVALIDETTHPQEQLEMLKLIVETCEKTNLMTLLESVDSDKKLKEIVLQRISDTQNS